MFQFWPKNPQKLRWSYWVLVTFHSKCGCDWWMLLRRGWVVGLRTNDRQVPAQSHPRLSLRHYRTAPVLLTEAGRFSCLCSLSSPSSSSVVCWAGRALSHNCIHVQGRKVHWGGKWSKIRLFFFLKILPHVKKDEILFSAAGNALGKQSTQAFNLLSPLQWGQTPEPSCWAASEWGVCAGMELSCSLQCAVVCCLPSSGINEQEQVEHHPHFHHVWNLPELFIH